MFTSLDPFRPMLDSLTDDEIRALPHWYYRVELRPGVFTEGQAFYNVGLTRAALRRTHVDEARCLDLGTMEGLIPTLLSRRGAKQVVAYDRPTSGRQKLAMVQRAYGANFDFVDGLKLSELRGALEKAGQAPFDVVVFSGVMYHMLDPLGGLAVARSLVREGGLLVIETAAIITHQPIFAGNVRDRFGGHSYLIPSLPLLEYFVRFFRLSVLDCEFWIGAQDALEGSVVCRVCLVTRAKSESMLQPEDPFAARTVLNDADLIEFIDWDALRSSNPPVKYRSSSIARFGMDQDRSLDVLWSVLGNSPRVVKPEELVLHLNDFW
jgi:SAM-dependent methyltransferase